MEITRLDRFLAKIAISEAEYDGTPCWHWIGAISDNGYSRFNDGYGHRWAYEYFIGELIDGLDLDHLCRNRWCVNPIHLEQVSRQENLRRGHGLVGINARKTICQHGHAFDEVNTYFRPDGKKDCLTCKKIRRRNFYLRNHK